MILTRERCLELMRERGLEFMAFARFKARGFVDLQVTERLFEKVLVAIPLALLLPLQPQSLGIFSREPETRVVFGQRLLESVTSFRPPLQLALNQGDNEQNLL